MERVLRFLVSRRSIVGFAAAGVGVVLNLLGILTGPFWLTIVVAMYVVAAEEPSQKGSILPAAMFVALLGALVHAVLTHAPTGSSITLAAGLLFSGATLIVRSALLDRRMHRLLRRERAALLNLADARYAFNFGNPFSGTHFGPPRTLRFDLRLKTR